MNSIEVQPIRSKLWSKGYRPIAVYSHDATIWTGQPIANRGKAPRGAKWPERARQNPPEAAIASPSADAQNTGILCDGLAGVDIDVDNPTIVSQIKSLAAQYLGNAPSRIRCDSPRCLYLYRAAEGEPSKRSVNGKHGKVEVLGRGNQFVAYGVHPDGVAYEWPDGAPDSFHRDALTPVTQEAIHAFLCAVAPLIGAEMPQSPSVVAGGPVLPIVAGTRPEATEREKTYALGALKDECQKFQAVDEGHRNEALNNAMVSIATMAAPGWIEAKLAWDTLWEAASLYRAEDGDEAAYKTMLSGWNYGIVRPRDPLPIVKAEECFETKHSKSATAKRTVTMLLGSQIKEKAVKWLWHEYLPQGKVTLLAGSGGAGKSTIAYNLASTITNGGAWPDGSRCNVAGNVLIWSSEDDGEDTIKPRLMIAGANPDRYGIIGPTLDEHGNRIPFDITKDMDGLRETALGMGGISLLILDPIVAVVKRDGNDNVNVRQGMQPLIDFASEMDCSVLGITHFTKGSTGKNPSERVMGASAFKDVARMNLIAAKDEESNRRVFARSKANNAPDNGGFNYTLEIVKLHSDIVTTNIVWGEALEGSARSILSDIEGDAQDDGSHKLNQAKQFLIDMLSNGPAPAKELIEHARETHGITAGTLRRASEALSIKPRKLAMNGGWVWEFPFSASASNRLQ